MSAEKDFRLNRVFSSTLTPWLLRLPVTPNQITSASLALGIAAGVLFSRGTYGWSLAAAACYELGSILDNCDGDVARAKNLGSEFGAWFDIAADIACDIALFAGLAIGVRRWWPGAPAMPFLAACLFGSAMHFTLVIVEKLRGFGPAVFEASNPDREGRRDPFFIVMDALREGDSSWIVVLLALAGKSDLLLWIGAFYMQVLWISAFFLNFKYLFARK